MFPFRALQRDQAWITPSPAGAPPPPLGAPPCSQQGALGAEPPGSLPASFSAPSLLLFFSWGELFRFHSRKSKSLDLPIAPYCPYQAMTSPSGFLKLLFHCAHPHLPQSLRVPARSFTQPSSPCSATFCNSIHLNWSKS